VWAKCVDKACDRRKYAILQRKDEVEMELGQIRMYIKQSEAFMIKTMLCKP
jgi:hypothetical protein